MIEGGRQCSPVSLGLLAGAVPGVRPSAMGVEGGLFAEARRSELQGDEGRGASAWIRRP